jgi:hypothetical protein
MKRQFHPLRLILSIGIPAFMIFCLWLFYTIGKTERVHKIWGITSNSLVLNTMSGFGIVVFCLAIFAIFTVIIRFLFCGIMELVNWIYPRE